MTCTGPKCMRFYGRGDKSSGNTHRINLRCLDGALTIFRSQLLAAAHLAPYAPQEHAIRVYWENSCC